MIYRNSYLYYLLLPLFLIVCCSLSVHAADTTATSTEITDSENVNIETAASLQSIDFSGGVITSIPRQRFLSNISTIHFYSNEDPAVLNQYLQEQIKGITSLEATISKDDQTYTTSLTVSWPDVKIDAMTPGTYELTGTIQAPDGCTFADGVMTSIRIPYIIHDVSVKSAITTLFNIQICTGGMMFSVDDNQNYEEQRNSLSDFQLSTVYGVTDDGQTAQLVVTGFDDSSVDIHTPGEYAISVTFDLEDSFKELFTLPDELKNWKIPVKVSDPAIYELWGSEVDDDNFTISTLHTPASDAKLLWLESSVELTLEQLSSNAWKEFPDIYLNPYMLNFQIPRSQLTKGMYNYFQIVSSTQESTILMIQDNGEQYNYKNMGGNRDGSSSEDSITGSVTQPAPAAPDSSSNTSSDTASVQTPSTPASSSKSGSKSNSDASAISESPTDPAPATESFSADQDHLYGVRLNLMRKTTGGTAAFSKHGIQLLFASDTLDQLAITDTDALTVTIEQPHKDTILISVQKNDADVTDIPSTKITVPWDAVDPSAEFLLQNASGNTICTGTYDEIQKLLTFYIQETGTYHICEQTTAAVSDGQAEPVTDSAVPAASASEADQSLPILPAILLLGLGSGISSAFLLHRKKESEGRIAHEK